MYEQKMCVTADRIYILDKSVINTRTKNPLKSAISEDFYYFFVYCGANYSIRRLHKTKMFSTWKANRERFSTPSDLLCLHLLRKQIIKNISFQLSGLPLNSLFCDSPFCIDKIIGCSGSVGDSQDRVEACLFQDLPDDLIDTGQLHAVFTILLHNEQDAQARR